MTTRIVHRPARTTLPEKTPEAALLDAPPQLAGGAGGMNLLALVPMLGAATSVTVMMLFRGSSLAGIGAIMMVATVLASVVLMFSQRGKATRQRATKRRLYMDYLRRRRSDFEAEEQRARARANAAHPPVNRLVQSVVNDPHRLWERRRTSPDFLVTRFGTGSVPRRPITIQDSGDAVERPDAFMLSEAEQLRRRFGSNPDMPLTLPLGAVSDVSIVGDRETALTVCRSLVCQLTSAQSPEDVELAIVVGEAELENWEWTKWLPHLQDRGTLRRAGSLTELAGLLENSLGARLTAVNSAARNFQQVPADALPRLIIVTDLPGQNAAALPGVPADLPLSRLAVTRIHVLTEQQQEPERVDLRLMVSPDALSLEATATGQTMQGVADDVPEVVAESVARALAPLRLSELSHEFGEHKSSRSYAEALGLTDYTAEAMLRLWKSQRGSDFLRVAIGEDEDGTPVHLDLKEPAQQGMGPHGLCVGATGSGKSELLRTIVLSLIATHSPGDLNMVLVDYKGGATFAPFEAAPHVSGLVTNLVSDASLVDRIYSSLAGEVKRRQELLKNGGDFAHINDYRSARSRHPDNPALAEPLPYLFVCIDEFGELLTARADFIDLLLSIGRIGRSIGIHLLLASQKVEQGMLRGLDTYLAYRIALHTNSESESRTIIDVPDAYHLPSTPGHGILKVDTTVFKRFRAAYVSGALPSPEDDAVDTVAESVPVQSFRLAEDSITEVSDDALMSSTMMRGGSVGGKRSQEETESATILSAVVGFAAEQPRLTQPVWLPPLPVAVSLAGTGASLDLTSIGPRLAQPQYLSPAVGILDDPARQWQGPWHLDLTARGGNLAIIGAPQSGKSTALRTIAASLALSHGVDDINIYAVDLLGNALTGLAGLPHCSGVAGRGNRELLRRTIEEVQGLLNVRQSVFDHHKLDSLQAMRALRSRGGLGELSCTDAFLVIDGFGSLTSEFPELEEAVHDVMTRGSTLGVHVLVSLRNWSDVRMSRQSLLGTRIELHLADPTDSLDRRLATTLGANRPGRALTMDKTIGHFALPSLSPTPDQDNAGQELAELGAVLHQYSALTAPPVRILPAITRLTRDHRPVRGSIALGVREHDAGTENLDLLGADRGAVVVGDPETGRTNLLRTAASQLMASHQPGELAFAVFDPRQQLQDFIPDEYLGEYASNAQKASQLAEFVAGQARDRLGDGSSAPVRSPKIVLLVDDYDILAATGNQPLRALASYLPSGADVGLFAMVTSRTTGSGMMMHDHFIAGLRAAGAPVIMFSGDRSEGVIANGERPVPLPVGRARILRTSRSPVTVQTFYQDHEVVHHEL
ncbi:Type VII secretion protein EccC [Arthrobacter sp. 9V]|uniref:type VII secretion protein EccCa n=1 Tax=Arthrobacter sp. 9V TaxID=2653132 RepID=UPI0012EFB770|nr:type VII secretion protein EccCa [Arthrobacter sp. 9V]VXC13995.1 Type VII secretion protein EccC [Arthrobacter sp. 9V]